MGNCFNSGNKINYPEISLHLIDKYLKVLGVKKSKVSFEWLCELVKAHLFNIPFENISKLYYKYQKRLNNIPDLELFLNGIENFHFGGTCYTNNHYFNLLLHNLGYETRLCGADMSKPDVHMVVVVTINNKEFIVDVGYGAPFCTPMPRKLNENFTVELGNSRFILKPQDKNGCSKMELFHNGKLKHGYTVKPAPRIIEEFNNVIESANGHVK